MLVCTGPFFRDKSDPPLWRLSLGFGRALGTTGHSMECHGDWGLLVWWSGREMEEGFENPSKGEVFALRMLSFSSARWGPLINVF